MPNNKNKNWLLIIVLPVVILFVVLAYQFWFSGNDKEVLEPSSHGGKDYIKSIELGGEWFLNNQNESFLYYEYNFVKGEYSDKTHSLREMGALWSIAKLSNFLGDERYNALAKKGFNHFENYFEHDKENDFYFVNITPQKIKLGYSAFVILTLLEIDNPKKEEYLEKFADGILFMQNESGELGTFFYSDRSTGKDYYPGEALLALMSLYEYTKKEKYLAAAQKAFPFYTGYFSENPNTAFVPWQSRAYYKLYQAIQDRNVADFLFEMNDFVLEEHSPKNDCAGFGFSRGIITAVYAEGVVQAYDLAKELGDEERSQCYFNFIGEASDYILSLQVIEGYGKEAIGGFIGSENSQTMKVDRNQHAVMALMGAYNSGILK